LYRFKIHYQFTSDKSVSVDLIWYLQNVNFHYFYDQFEIYLDK
jgi:hypothetical protein